MPAGRQFPQFVVALVATGFALGTGIVLGWSAPMEPQAKDGDFGFNITDEEFSWVGSALPLGAVIFCLPAGFLMEKIGRKLAAICLVIPFVIGWAIIILANAVWMLILGRAFLGMAAGSTCVVIPMYVGEIAQKEIRGILSGCFQMQITVGVLVAYVVGSLTTPAMMNTICSVFPVLFAIGMVFLPETPFFCIKKQARVKAEKSFKCLRGKDYDASEEWKAIEADVEETKNSSFSRAFKQRAFLKALYLTVLLQIFQQVSGINAVIFYATEIFRLSGSTLKPEICTIIVGATQVVVTLISIFIVDKLGRRMLLLISAAVMALSTLGLGVYFFLQEQNPDSIKSLGWLPILSLCLYIVVFSLGFGPVPWIMVGELFPPDAKGPGGAVAAIANWLGAFIVSKSYPTMKNAMGAGPTFWLYSALTILGFVFVLFLVPETKGKSLSEIQDNLKSGGKSN